MPSNDYIPRSDSGFRDWADAFASKLVARPWAFMLSPAEAAGLRAEVDNFIVAYEAAIDPERRTKPVIARKDDARSIAESLCRTIASQTKQNLGVSDADKLSLDIRPINPTKRKINCPQTAPILAFIGCTPGQQILTYKDPTMPYSKAKAYGASHLELFLAITDTPGPAPLSEARFYRNCARNPVYIKYSPEQNGKFATAYARWCSRRGETGPWSMPVTMVIAGPLEKKKKKPKEGDGETRKAA